MLTKRIAAAFKLLPVALFVTTLLGCKPPGPKALLDGERLLEKRRPEAAVARLEVATELMATNANAWNYLGIAYHQLGRSSNAVLAYQRALMVDADLVETRLNLGSLWLELGRPADAKSEFTAYNLRRPNDPAGFARIALAEMYLRETAAAEQHIRKALQLDDRNADAWNTLGLVQLQQRKVRDAAQSFGSALRLDPAFPSALINLAVVLHQQLGDRAEALKCYRQYLALEPRPSDADAVTMVVQQLEREMMPAQQVTRAAVPQRAVIPSPTNRAQPLVPKSNMTAAPAAPPSATLTPTSAPKPSASAPQPKRQPVEPVTARVKTPKPAPRVAPTPVERDIQVAPVVEVPPPPAVIQTAAAPRVPTPEPAMAGAGGTGRVDGESTRNGVAAIEPARIQRRPGVTPLPPPQNRVLVESSTATEAVMEGPDGAARSRTSDRIAAERFAAKGSKAMTAKRYVEAADAYRAAAKADPGWYQAHFNYAAAAIESGRTAEAIAACQKALELKPDSPEARYNYALALRQAGRSSDAAAQLERIVEAKPTDARAHLTLGNLYADQLRQTDKARLHYLKVLEINPGHSQAGAIHFWLAANPAR